MMISSKGRYALRVMVFLAEHNSDEYVPLKEISEKEQISQKYLESIARMLSKEHLIEGISGHGGGYRLARKPEDYRISEILRLTEGTLAPVSCLKDDAVPCDRAGDCCTLPIWKGLAELVDKYFDSMTLKEVAENARQQMIQNQRSNEKVDTILPCRIQTGRFVSQQKYT